MAKGSLAFGQQEYPLPEDGGDVVLQRRESRLSFGRHGYVQTHILCSAVDQKRASASVLFLKLEVGLLPML